MIYCIFKTLRILYIANIKYMIKNIERVRDCFLRSFHFKLSPGIAAYCIHLLNQSAIFILIILKFD